MKKKIKILVGGIFFITLFCNIIIAPNSGFSVFSSVRAQMAPTTTFNTSGDAKQDKLCFWVVDGQPKYVGDGRNCLAHQGPDQNCVVVTCLPPPPPSSTN